MIWNFSFPPKWGNGLPYKWGQLRQLFAVSLIGATRDRYCQPNYGFNIKLGQFRSAHTPQHSLLLPHYSLFPLLLLFPLCLSHCLSLSLSFSPPHRTSTFDRRCAYHNFALCILKFRPHFVCGETNLLSLHVFGVFIGQAVFAFRLRFVLLFAYPAFVESAKWRVYAVDEKVCNGSLILIEIKYIWQGLSFEYLVSILF